MGLVLKTTSGMDLGGKGTLLRILETVCIELPRILTTSSHLIFPNMEDGCLKTGL